jgi:hypothetical protein
MLSMLNCQKSFKLTGSLLYLTVIKISEINVWENRSGNQEWTIQRHWQHWAHKTQDEDKQIKKTQHRELNFFCRFRDWSVVFNKQVPCSCARKRQLDNVSFKQQSVICGRWWPIGIAEQHFHTIIFFVSCSSLNFRHHISYFYESCYCSYSTIPLCVSVLIFLVVVSLLDNLFRLWYLCCVRTSMIGKLFVGYL